MDLTFQVPMQYCSLQQWTLLLSPVTSTTGCCFCFGSISSFFLGLILYQSPLAYWALTDLESLSFSVLSFCLFIPFMGFSMGYKNHQSQHSQNILAESLGVENILVNRLTATCTFCKLLVQQSYLCLFSSTKSFILHEIVHAWG